MNTWAKSGSRRASGSASTPSGWTCPIWLYDEYNWPSGSCKGRVPAENPDFESRQYAVYKNADGTFDVEVAHSPGWVDNYSFKAMERFIELTHKKYEQRLGPVFGLNRRRASSPTSRPTPRR